MRLSNHTGILITILSTTAGTYNDFKRLGHVIYTPKNLHAPKYCKTFESRLSVRKCDLCVVPTQNFVLMPNSKNLMGFSDNLVDIKISLAFCFVFFLIFFLHLNIIRTKIAWRSFSKTFSNKNNAFVYMYWNDFKFMAWPANSPDLNPIENLCLN